MRSRSSAGQCSLTPVWPGVYDGNWFKGSSLAFPLEEAHILAALRGLSVLLLGSLLALHGGNEEERVSPLLGDSRALSEEGPAQSSCSSC